jgi:hypothetical protein
MNHLRQAFKAKKKKKREIKHRVERTHGYAHPIILVRKPEEEKRETCPVVECGLSYTCRESLLRHFRTIRAKEELGESEFCMAHIQVLEEKKARKPQKGTQPARARILAPQGDSQGVQLELRCSVCG